MLKVLINIEEQKRVKLAYNSNFSSKFKIDEVVEVWFTYRQNKVCLKATIVGVIDPEKNFSRYKRDRPLSNYELITERDCKINRQQNEELIDHLNFYLEENQKRIKELRMCLANNGADMVQKYCDDLKMDVDLATETLIEKIQDQRVQLLNEVDLFGDILIQKLGSL